MTDSPEMVAALARYPREALVESGIPGVPPTLVMPVRVERPEETAARAAADRELFEPDLPRNLR